jgi:hypothetical protein
MASQTSLGRHASEREIVWLTKRGRYEFEKLDLKQTRKKQRLKNITEKTLNTATKREREREKKKEEHKMGKEEIVTVPSCVFFLLSLSFRTLV